jgi:tetratricopeptide (TPR) repeat protein
MPDTYDYDVFISYSSVDRDWVRNDLLPILEGAGLRVCIDYRDFQPGAPRPEEIQRAVLTSRRTLLILTPDYLTSEWANFGNMMVQFLDPNNRERSMIPLMLTQCELPPRIAYLTPVDFASATVPEDREIERRKLLNALGRPPLPETPPPPERKDWLLAHPYPMPPHFTGRATEQAQLNSWLNNDAAHPLLLLRALGGFGKSALAWHWLLQAVDPAHWPCVVWWSFYESEATFERFLERTLAYLGIDPDSRSGARQQAAALLECLRRPGLLLILDGFERELRAYSGMGAAYQGDAPKASATETAADERARREGISPVADDFLQAVATLPGLRGKLLLTSRLRPCTLEGHDRMPLQGCQEIALTQMQPADAVAFFGALGIRGNHADIAAAGARYGYHPLSLRLLAGLVLKDLRQPGDIRAAERLDVSGDLIQRRNHVLAQSYAGLTPARQQLLSRIACFRSPVAYAALVAIASPDQAEHDRPDHAPSSQVDRDLRSLLERGLLQRDERTNRFDLHPIVRRYAYDQLGDTTRRAAHGQLRNYFAAVEVPPRVENLDDLLPLIELYHHTVRAGQFDEARTLFRYRIHDPIYYQFGAYQVQIDLLQALFPGNELFTATGHAVLPHLADERAQAWTLNELANSYSASGQPRRAIPLYNQHNKIYEDLPRHTIWSQDYEDLPRHTIWSQDEVFEKRGNVNVSNAIGLGNLAYQQMMIGMLRTAETNLCRQIELCQLCQQYHSNIAGWSIEQFNEMVGTQEMGRLLSYRGMWGGAKIKLAVSTDYWEMIDDIQGLFINEAYHVLLALLRVRTATLQSPQIVPTAHAATDHAATALTAAHRALELADEDARTNYPVERDYVWAHWLLGAAHRLNGALAPDAGQQFAAAEQHLTEALTRCRSINLVEMEADILLELARLRAATGNRDAALHLAQEALTITERCGYVLPGADVHLLLAGLLDHESREKALAHARAARRLATCDGPPDHTYRVAYAEAGQLLTRLGEPPTDG